MHEGTHIGVLVAQVVEVQHIRVSLSAVNAGVIGEVVVDSTPEARLSDSSAYVAAICLSRFHSMMRR